jgi:hypothetical protein
MLMNKMNRYCVAILIAVLLSSGTAFAQGTGGLGIGIILGEPTGLSLKKWLDDRRAIDAAAAWTFAKNSSFTFHADYLLHRYDLINDQMQGNGSRIPIYFGLGARLTVGDETKVGMRIPLGLSYVFKKYPLDFFIEIAPGLNLVPSSDLMLSGGVGIRYYIK